MNSYVTQSKTVDNKKPQDAKQLALLAQLRKVSGEAVFYYTPRPPYVL
jgi:hypothetical protein